MSKERGQVSCSVNAAAEYLGVSVKTIYRWKDERILSFIQMRPGGKILFEYEELDAFRKRHLVQYEPILEGIN